MHPETKFISNRFLDNAVVMVFSSSAETTETQYRVVLLREITYTPDHSSYATLSNFHKSSSTSRVFQSCIDMQLFEPYFPCLAVPS